MLILALRRLAVAMLLIVFVSLLVFVLMRALPGDPALIALGDAASAGAIAAYRARLGLDDPLVLQYWHWMAGIVLHGDFGLSALNEQRISPIIAQRLPNTLMIALPAIVIGVLLGVPVGIVTAIRRGSLAVHGLTLLVNSFLGTPRFLVAMFGVLILALKWRLIPLQGYTAPWVDFGAYLHKACWPVMVSSFYIIAVVARHTRANMIDVMNQDFIRTARANGLAEYRVVFGHALKHALIPVITTIGLEMPQIIGGAVVVESVFNIPGIGQLVLNGVTDRDYLVVQAAVLVISVVTIGSNLLIDLAYVVIDPRVRRGAV